MQRLKSENRCPWIKFYFNDYIACATQKLFNLDEKGAYMLLYSHSCQSHGKLSYDSKILGKLLNITTSKMEKILKVIVPTPLIKIEGNELIFLQVSESLQEQEVIRKQRQTAGKKGARKKWIGSEKKMAEPSTDGK